jgi:elongation factor G
MAYSTVDIRNLALVGQAGAGKTLLTETLLAQTGAIRVRGSLERGTTVCDFDPQEKSALHSLDASIVHFDYGDCHVNLIDTPGSADCIGRALPMLEAVETAAIVVNAVNGIEPVTQRMLEFARDRELCRPTCRRCADASACH